MNTTKVSPKNNTEAENDCFQDEIYSPEGKLLAYWDEELEYYIYLDREAEEQAWAKESSSE